MKNYFIIIVLFIGINSSAQNSFNAMKSSKRAGILSTMVNPAEMAGMAQKFDLNVIGFDFHVSNNLINLTSSNLRRSENLADSFFRTIGNEGLNVRIHADIVGPSVAYALNKKTTIGLMTRVRVHALLNNMDVALGRSIENNTIDVSLPYTSPDIKNMRATLLGWTEVNGSIAREIMNEKRNVLKIGGSVKVIFPGAYGNAFFNNVKFQIDTNPSGQTIVKNAQGQFGLEYNGTNNPMDDGFKNISGGPKGIGFDLGMTYLFKKKNSEEYLFKLGASLLDIGSIRFQNNPANTRQFVMNPNATFAINDVKSKNFDELIENVKETGAVTELASDTTVIVGLPMAINLQADMNVWKGFYLTMNLQRRASSNENQRSVQASEYITFIPRYAQKFIELYMPITFAEVYGTTIGAGMKVGPIYLGSSSIVSALASEDNKAIDVHFGLRMGLGKTVK